MAKGRGGEKGCGKVWGEVRKSVLGCGGGEGRCGEVWGR